MTNTDIAIENAKINRMMMDAFDFADSLTEEEKKEIEELEKETKCH